MAQPAWTFTPLARIKLEVGHYQICRASGDAYWTWQVTFGGSRQYCPSKQQKCVLVSALVFNHCIPLLVYKPQEIGGPLNIEHPWSRQLHAHEAEKGVFYGPPNMQGPHYGGLEGLPGSRAPFPSEVTRGTILLGGWRLDSDDARHWLHVGRICFLMWNWERGSKSESRSHPYDWARTPLD
jgi:hypothetical protein